MCKKQIHDCFFAHRIASRKQSQTTQNLKRILRNEKEKKIYHDDFIVVFVNKKLN